MKLRERVAHVRNTLPVPIARPFQGNPQEFGSDPEIVIVFTSFRATVSAIEHTAALIEGLDFRMSLGLRPSRDVSAEALME